MAGQPGRQQSSFASGELGDLLAERKNLKYYRTGLKRLENAIVLAQGPATLRPYTRQISRRRRAITFVSLAGAGLAAPAGGAPEAAVDGSPVTIMTTGTLPPGGPHVVFALTFPAPQAITAVDVASYRCHAGAGQIAVEFQAGDGSWVSLNGARKLITAKRSRRFCAAPDQPVASTAWRVIVSGLSEATAIDIMEVLFWSEGAGYGAAQLRSFSFSRTASYDIVLQASHGDVYAAEGGWLTGFAIPHSAEEIRCRWHQRLNTGLMFCPTRPIWRVFRENTDYEWECGPVTLDNLPDHDYGDRVYDNGQAAVWDLNGVNMTDGDYFTITVDGEETDSILFKGEPAEASPLTAANIQAALEKLPNLQPGFETFDHLAIYFTGNEGPVTINATRVLNKSTAAMAYLRVEKGRAGGEPILSDARGWPRCGIIYQQRLIAAGATGVPNALLFSQSGEFFDFNTEVSSAAGGFVVPMDTKGAETIEELIDVRALLIFTSGREYWVSNSSIDKSTPLEARPASSFGLAENVPVVENEGGAVFVARNGSVLCEFRYNETDQTFVSNRISLLASHLVENVRDLAIQRSHSSSDANLLYFVQADGALRVVTLLREQDITAFARVTSAGSFHAVICNEANRVTVLAERMVAGQPVQFIERFEDGLLVDQAITRSYETPRAVIDGLGDHEGASVWAIADQEVFGPFTVIAGQITLPVETMAATVGRWAPFYAETLPPIREIGPEIVTQSRVGFHSVRVSLKDTTSLAIGANGGDIEEVPMLRFGDAPDVPSLNHGVTGLRERDGIQGDADEPIMVVTQLRPGRITLRSITGEGDI